MRKSILISLMILYTNAYSSESIGFKGLYLNADKVVTCSQIKEYANKAKLTYDEDKLYCGAFKSQSGNYMNDYRTIWEKLLITFDKNNKVSSILIEPFWTDFLLNSSSLSQDELAEAFVKNLDWLDNLEVEKKSLIVVDLKFYVKRSKDWKISISQSKKIELDKIVQINFN